jgi:hypothetical protein
MSEDRSQHNGDFLTPHERETMRLGSGKPLTCPDCVPASFLCRGPSGGGSTNYACRQCGSEFNLMVVPVQFSARISDRGPRELGERSDCYADHPN